MDKDYSKLLCDHLDGGNTFYNILGPNESIQTFENANVADISTIKFKKYQSKPNLGCASKQERFLNSFENTLTPLESKTQYDQMSPFSSAKTLNRLESLKNDKKRFMFNNETARCNRKVQDISESNLTLKEGSLSPNCRCDNASQYEVADKSHSKNMSFYSNCGCMEEIADISAHKSCTKCNNSRQNAPFNTSRSPYSDGKDSNKNYRANRKGKIRIINQGKIKLNKDINDSDEIQVKYKSQSKNNALIQPLPCMKSISNYNTFREASLPRSVTSFKNLVDAKHKKLEKRAESRNKGFIIFPTQSKDMITPSSSIVNSTCNLTAVVKSEKNNQSIIQCKRKKYKQN